MTRIHLIRHGSAAAGWTEARDPGLSEFGVREARLAATRLAKCGPLSLITSPLRRARETAAAFERVWQCTAIVDMRLAEIPVPVFDLAEREEWLQRMQSRSWAEVRGTSVATWRLRLIEWAASTRVDTLAVSHFMAINVLVGCALCSKRIVCCHPSPASCTTLECLEDSWQVIPA